MSTRVLLDTDTVSLIQRGDRGVEQRAQVYLSQHGELSFSELTWYEIVRAYRAVGATTQLAVFEEFCELCQILPLDRRALDSAAGIYADLRRRAQPIGEVDLLIAGIALTNGFGVVTCNTDHFQRVAGLRVENWVSR